MRKVLLLALLLGLSLALASQEVLPTNYTLTPKEQALQLLDNLEQNNNDQQILIEQSQTELQTALENSEKLKDSLKKTASYSDSLEKSLMLSQTINKVSIPTVFVAIGVAILVAIFKK